MKLCDGDAGPEHGGRVRVSRGLATGTLDTLGEAGRRARPDWPLLATLSITQTIGYGVLSYSFSVLLAPMTEELGTSTAAITSALAVAMIVAAVSAVPIGRWLDRRGGRGLMTAGAVVGCVAVVAWSQARSLIALYIALALVGLARAMMLYEPAFAVIIRRVTPLRRATALLSITVVAGFASTIFMPVTGLLVEWWDWRRALLGLACLLVVAVPLHALVVPGRQGKVITTESKMASTDARRLAMRDRGFWLLVLAFTANAVAGAVIAVHLVTYLIRLGHPPTFAATAAGLLGALSVTGRLVTTRLRRRWSITTVTAAVFLIQAVAVALLPVVGSRPVGAIACVAGFGLGFGVATIARPALLADRYGTTAYAAISGVLALPVILSAAAAPVAAALVIGDGNGYRAVIGAVSFASVLAAVMLWSVGRPARGVQASGSTDVAH